MVLSCTKCGSPSASFLTFSYDDRAVWIEDIAGMPGPNAYPLCAAHADRMIPPQGWTLTDLRTATRLFAPLSVA